jgi:hypothetical protein
MHVQVLSSQAVMSLHLPLIVPLMTDTVRAVAAKQDGVLWFNEARRITFYVAARAVLGELLTIEKAEQLFPLFQEMSSGCFALVSTCCMPLAPSSQTGSCFNSSTFFFGVLALQSAIRNQVC